MPYQSNRDTGENAAVGRAPIVHTDGDSRLLLFADGVIQSEMSLSAPERLVLAYTRAMMGFALFAPRPRHIAMVGLGGGSLAKFCHRHLPGTRITVLEIDPQVIAVRDQFQVPPDSPAFTVLETDAVLHMAEVADTYDVILVDGFGGNGMPAALGTARFYADCRRALRAGGVLVANLHQVDPDYAAVVARLDGAFAGQTCRLRAVAGNNHIFYALKSAGATSRARLTLDLMRRYGAHSGILNRLIIAGLLRLMSLRRRQPA